MKGRVALAAGLAGYLVLPGGIGADELDALERALAETVRALEVLDGIRERAAEAPHESAGLVLAATEEAHLDERARDDRLLELRREVSRLQAELDTLESTPGTAGAQPAPGLHNARPAPLRTPTTGLDEAKRAGLFTAKTGGVATIDEDSERTAAVAPVEHEGYSADPVAHARACFRSGRFEKGLTLLERRPDPESLYWRARCHEGLGRLPEAIELLERVVAEAGDSPLGQRSAADLEFLRWKEGFLENLPRGMRSGEGEGVR